MSQPAICLVAHSGSDAKWGYVVQEAIEEERKFSWGVEAVEVAAEKKELTGGSRAITRRGERSGRAAEMAKLRRIDRHQIVSSA